MGEHLEEQLELGLDVIRFDGGENSAKWEAHGVPKGVIPDQYVASCSEGAVNLHILQMGKYAGCFTCSERDKCIDSDGTAAEQMDF